MAYLRKIEQLIHGQSREIVAIEDEHNCQVKPLVSDKIKDTLVMTLTVHVRTYLSELL